MISHFNRSKFTLLIFILFHLPRLAVSISTPKKLFGVRALAFDWIDLSDNRMLPILDRFRVSTDNSFRVPWYFLLRPVRREETAERIETLPLHSPNSHRNYCCHSLLQTVGRRIVEIVPRRAALSYRSYL